MKSIRLKRFGVTFQNVLLLLYWTLFMQVRSEGRNSTRLSDFLRNLSETSFPTTTEDPTDYRITTWRPVRSIPEGINNRQLRLNSSVQLNNSSDSESKPRGRNFRRGKSLAGGAQKVQGVDKKGRRKPEELIRTALINHTLEHGGEEDLDKLVFSNLPQGQKLVLRTVRIIRTDENGDPLTDSEGEQPTYWDVTLANATEPVEDGEEEEDEAGEEEEEYEDERPTGRRATAMLRMRIRPPVRINATRGNGTKKSDLESSGSHSSANYHMHNDYGGAGRDKEYGKTNYHGNTHGKHHKHTYTVTDGKDVKPYHGTEKGVNDHAYGQDYNNKDNGERYKSSKRKNKGRKVTGFKRVYHKEEFQRTEHFYDDEEARKIAESFGLSEAKLSNDHGTKGDKRKYHGVRTEYLDGKEHKNEHGTHNGYNKGNHNVYKDTERHNQNNNYGKHKSQSHYGGNGHQGHHDDGEYHPNHNYHGSYSSPKKTRLPNSIGDKLGLKGAQAPSVAAAAIISAPIATSFTVTEYAPTVQEAASTPNPTVVPLPIENGGAYQQEQFVYEPPPKNFTNSFNLHSGNDTDYENEENGENGDDYEGKDYGGKEENGGVKEEEEKKIFFSPKHRDLKEEEKINNENEIKYIIKSIQPMTVPLNALPFQPIPSYPTRSSFSPSDNSQPIQSIRNLPLLNKPLDNSQFAPHFKLPLNHQRLQQPEYNQANQQLQDPRQNLARYPKSWRWHHRRRPRPLVFQDSPHGPLAPAPAPSAYPKLHHQGQLHGHLATIPMRHANAYHRLGDRLRYTFHRPRPYFEASTRKSDEGVVDEKESFVFGKGLEKDTDKNSTSEKDDYAKNYFNHNHRYAKNYLTSTIPTSNVEGVRNTLLDSNPNVYSTIIKVLPATMLDTNSNTTVTQRPKTFADLVSITTAYPNLLQQSQQLQPQLRPFLPRGRWINFNIGNNYPQYNPNGVSKLMRGIRTRIMRPFTRPTQAYPGMIQIQPTLISAATASPVPVIPAVQVQQGIQLQKAPSTRTRFLNLFRRQPQPTYQQVQVPVTYPTYSTYLGGGISGILSMGSRDNVNTIRPPASFMLTPIPPTLSSQEDKPRFYYIFNPNMTTTTPKTDKLGEVPDPESETKSPYKPTLKVSPSKTTLADGPIIMRREFDIKDTIQPLPQPPKFVSGLMDSVSGFFGKKG